MSVDTALKEKVHTSKAKEFLFPMPLDTSSKPTHQRRSSTGGPNATWTPLNSPKHEFVHNKVFQKKYNTAATTIQRVLRGFFGRYEAVRILSAIQIQTMVRQRRQRLVLQKQAAIVVVQAYVRGWRCRIRTKVFQLEHELRLIEQRKKRDMLDLQAWKQQEIENIRLSAQSMSKEASQQSFRYKETLEQAEKLIKHLRKENKKLRDKNDALQVAINLMFEENKILEKQALEYKIYSERMNDMAMINHENEALTDLLCQFETRKVEFEEAIICRDERIMFENKVGRLYLNGIQGIVLAIEDACDDEDLVFLVEELCLHCNIPGSGSGLDEMEQEVSERMLY
jgi:IQ calmodulin-binding motif